MYEVIITDTYKKKAIKFFKKHPDLLEKYKKILLIINNNPFHPSLRIHKLKGKLKNFYSVSIDLKYRIIISFLEKENYRYR